jgi:hypothetical protein
MGMFKSRRVEWVVFEGHVAKGRHPYRKRAWKYAGRISLGRPQRSLGRSNASDVTETVL